MTDVELRLPQNEMIRLIGPAIISVDDGSVMILGAELSVGDMITIPEYRSYTLKALSTARLHIRLSEWGRIEPADPSEEPLDDWVTIAENVMSSCELPCRVAIIGPRDSGKTSFSALLTNRCLARGIPVALIDSDIGQADIGPPGFISLAFPSNWTLWLRDLEPELMRFVGSIEPAPVAGRILAQTNFIANYAENRGAGIIVIDTDGWVEGWGALEYKMDLVRTINVNVVIVLGDPGLYELFNRIKPGKVFYARTPSTKVTRDREDRRALRSLNYRRFLENGVTREIDMKNVSAYGSCLFGSTPFHDSKILSKIKNIVGESVKYIGKYPGGYCIVVKKENIDTSMIRSLQKELSGEIVILNEHEFQGILVGLSDGIRDHPAIVEEVDIDNRIVTVRTRYLGEVKSVVFGRIRLEDYKEVSKRRIWI